MCIKKLRDDDISVTGYWYNPNIHPYTEYQSRLAALKGYSESISIPMIYNDFYGLRLFLKRIEGNIDNRCGICYEERLTAVAKEAKKDGFDAFSTTLLISPYQQHEKIKIIGERIGNEIGIRFYYVDFRDFFREGQRIARSLPLYMQKYCGCIFSEEERYFSKTQTRK